MVWSLSDVLTSLDDVMLFDDFSFSSSSSSSLSSLESLLSTAIPSTRFDKIATVDKFSLGGSFRDSMLSIVNDLEFTVEVIFLLFVSVFFACLFCDFLDARFSCETR